MRAQRFDDADARIIHDLYEPLRAFAAVVGPPDTEPDDLVHDVLLSALRRGSLTSIDQPLAYFRRALVNTSSGLRRRFTRQTRAMSVMVGGQSAWADEFPSDLVDLMALPPRERGVLYLQAVEGLPLTDIAEQLGITEPAARMAASRARRRLRDVIELAGERGGVSDSGLESESPRTRDDQGGAQ